MSVQKAQEGRFGVEPVLNLRKQTQQRRFLVIDDKPYDIALQTDLGIFRRERAIQLWARSSNIMLRHQEQGYLNTDDETLWNETVKELASLVLLKCPMEVLDGLEPEDHYAIVQAFIEVTPPLETPVEMAPVTPMVEAKPKTKRARRSTNSTGAKKSPPSDDSMAEP